MRFERPNKRMHLRAQGTAFIASALLAALVAGQAGGTPPDPPPAAAELAAAVAEQARLYEASVAPEERSARGRDLAGLVTRLGEELAESGRHAEAAELYARADGLVGSPGTELEFAL